MRLPDEPMGGQAWTARGAAPSPRAVSVCILNRDRPHLLPRVLAGLDHLRHGDFEVIVVSDRPSVGALGLDPAMAARIRYGVCHEPNISRARNIAIALAAGDIVAFCDDDAVPEPDWLCRLTEPFADPWLGAAGGIVRGRDGITIQCGGSMFDRTGEAHAMDALGPDQPMRIFPPQPDWQVGFMGVNSAFRRSAITQIGGFDESYHYFLDETDALMRLGRAGWSVALVPRAEIHHLYTDNASRGRLQKPRDLYQIAASKAYFCTRHAPDRQEAALAQFRARRLADLDRFIQLGLMSGEERSAIAERLDLGLDAGLRRTPRQPLVAAPPQGAFLGFARQPATRLDVAVLPGWGLGATAAADQLARGLARRGHVVTCLSYRLGRARPRVTFQDRMWLHVAGTWRLVRDGCGRAVIHRAARARAELARVLPRRQFDLVLRPQGRRHALGWATVAVLTCPDLGLALAVDAPGPIADPALLATLAQGAAEALRAPVVLTGPGGLSLRGQPSYPRPARPAPRALDPPIAATVSSSGA